MHQSTTEDETDFELGYIILCDVQYELSFSFQWDRVSFMRLSDLVCTFC